MTAVVVVMLLLAVNFPAYVAIGRLVFGSVDAFGDALGYLFQSEFWAWWQGEGPEYESAHLRLTLFFAAGAGLVWGEYRLVMWALAKITGG